MAYAFGFPPDVTNLIYSFRDKNNWNGDKYRRGSTRDAANWATCLTSLEFAYPASLLPLAVLRLSSSRIIHNKITPTTCWGIIAHPVPWRPRPEPEIRFDYPPNDYSGMWHWFSLENKTSWEVDEMWREERKQSENDKAKSYLMVSALPQNSCKTFH